MSAREDSKAIAFSENVFRRLLWAYPAVHREEYGEPMAQLFRDQCHDAWNRSRSWGLACLWLRVLPDVVGTSFWEHLETIKLRRIMFKRSETGFGAAKFFTVFTAVFLLVVITTTVVTFILPESFASTARISIRHTDHPGYVPSSSSGSFPATSTDYDPYFVQTQIEVVQSQVVLGKTVERLNLTERWGKKFRGGERLTTPEAITFLKSSMELRPVRNTTLLEIRVYSDKPDEAAELANGVAESYRDYVESRRREAIEAGINSLRQQLDKVNVELNLAQTNLNELRRETGLDVLDSMDEGDAPTPTLSAEIVRQVQSHIVELQSSETKLKTLIANLDGLDRQKLRGAIQIVMESDSELNTYVTDLNTAEQRLLSLKTTVASDHPNYINAQQQIDLLNDKINTRVDLLLFGYKTRLEAIRADIAVNSNRLVVATKTDHENAARTRPYWEAKRKLTERSEFRKVLQMKIAAEEADLRTPREPEVEILDRALPNVAPVRPNKPLNIAIGVVLGTLLGLLAGAGVAGFSFLFRRSTPPKTA